MRLYSILFLILPALFLSCNDEGGEIDPQYYLRGSIDGQSFSWDLSSLTYYATDTDEPCGTVCLYGAGFYEPDDGDPATLYNGKRIIIYNSLAQDLSQGGLEQAFQAGKKPVCSANAGKCLSLIFTPANGTGSYRPDDDKPATFQILERSLDQGGYFTITAKMEMALESIIQDRNDRIERFTAQISIPVHY